MTDPLSKLTWVNVRVKLGDLKPWADNPKYSTKAQAERLLKSFAEFGQVQTVAVGPELQVYDGHQRLSALLTIHGAGYELDARQASRPLTDDERRRLVITLHAGAVGSWNWDVLGNWKAPELIEWGLDAGTLKGWQKDTGALTMMLESEGEIKLPDGTPQEEPKLPTECFIEIYCSKADLQDFTDTLQGWQERDGVTINIS